MVPVCSLILMADAMLMCDLTIKSQTLLKQGTLAFYARHDTIVAHSFHLTILLRRSPSAFDRQASLRAQA
jgi:hypothetical protein